mmetsp:Transcript_4025/g.5510  ORF Transcript_4025/g.5510 Transcript_4025/m.5510 type:complete len:232 (+) Transcript_4025:1605-2300(+)
MAEQNGSTPATSQILERSTETVIHPNGSRTVTTIIRSSNADGSTTIDRESVTYPGNNDNEQSSTITPSNHASTMGQKEGTTSDDEGPKDRSLLFLATILLEVVMVIVGLVTIIKTARSHDYVDNPDYVTDGEVAQVTGAIAIVGAAISTPLAFCEASRANSGRARPYGVKGLMTASWVIYGIGLFNAVGILLLSFQDEATIPTAWVGTLLVWLLIGWVFMMIHTEAAIRGP